MNAGGMVYLFLFIKGALKFFSTSSFASRYQH